MIDRVERSVEAGDGTARRAAAACSAPDPVERDRLVQRGQRHERFEIGAHLVVDAARLHEPFTAVHDSMADGVDVTAGLDEAPEDVGIVRRCVLTRDQLIVPVEQAAA